MLAPTNIERTEIHSLKIVAFSVQRLSVLNCDTSATAFLENVRHGSTSHLPELL